MMKRSAVFVLVAAVAAVPAGAQQRAVNARLAAGQPNKFAVPLCPMKAMNSKIDKAIGSIRKSYEAKTPADKAALLAEAKQLITTAITQEAQTGNSAAWYYLGRIGLLEGDAAAADSGFTKAQELNPSCEIDITQYRQNNWALLGQAGIDLQRKGQTDSALAQFRDASLLFRELPHVYSNMGVVFANSKMEDSAAVYFAKALAIAEKDTALVEDRNGAALNLAIIDQRLNRNLEAITVLHKYLGWKPDDTDAKKALAIAFRNAGMEDSASAIERDMVSMLAKSNLDSLDAGDLMAVGVAAFNAGRYAEAETAFGSAVRRNAWSRDARYNLANTFFAVAQQAHGPADSLRKAFAGKPIPDSVQRRIAEFDRTANRADSGLVAEAGVLADKLEPMNEDVLRLLAQGQRGLKQDQAVYKTAERLVALPFSVEVSLFQMGASGSRVAAEAVGRAPTDASGKPIKAAPMTLVFEFVDVNGAAVDSKEVTVPALTTGQKHPINVEGKGPAIQGWRYRIKPS